MQVKDGGVVAVRSKGIPLHHDQYVKQLDHAGSFELLADWGNRPHLEAKHLTPHPPTDHAGGMDHITLYVTKGYGKIFQKKANGMTHNDVAICNDRGVCILGPTPHNANLPGTDMLRAMYLVMRYTKESGQVVVLGSGLTTAIAARVLGRTLTMLIPQYAQLDSVLDDYEEKLEFCGAHTYPSTLPLV